MVFVVGFADLAVHDAPIVVRRVEGGEDTQGDTEIIAVKYILVEFMINYGIYIYLILAVSELLCSGCADSSASELKVCAGKLDRSWSAIQHN